MPQRKMMQTWIYRKLLSTYVFQDRLYVTITLLRHSSKQGSKSQATLCRGLQVQLQSLTDHPRASSENLMISTSIMVTEVTNWQIAGSFAILWRISNWYKYNTTEMMLWQKATYFQNTAIWGHLYVVKILRDGAIIFFSWIVKCFSLWQSGFSESERMSGSVWCPKRLIRQRKSCLYNIYPP